MHVALHWVTQEGAAPIVAPELELDGVELLVLEEPPQPLNIINSAMDSAFDLVMSLFQYVALQYSSMVQNMGPWASKSLG